MSGFVHEAAVGNSVEWYTPKSVFDALDTWFDLDVCSSDLSIAGWQTFNGRTVTRLPFIKR